MKTLSIATSVRSTTLAALLVGAASFSHADYKLVNLDGSSLSALCVAAAESPAKVNELARAHGILAHEIDTVRCNELSLKRFALKYGSAPASTPAVAGIEVAGYVLRKNDTSPLTELCAAAAVSEAELAKVKAEHFSGDREVETEVLCNGEPLKSFARKFRNADIRLVTVR